MDTMIRHWISLTYHNGSTLASRADLLAKAQKSIGKIDNKAMRCELQQLRVEAIAHLMHQLLLRCTPETNKYA